MKSDDERHETLNDGSEVIVRPIRFADTAAHAEFIAKLSAPSKHFLFLGGVARMSDAALRQLCDPDRTHDMAYVAVVHRGATHREIGISRYAGADSTHGAEISIAVADDWQHRGLGRRLLERLIEHARHRDVKRLYSIDAVNNDRMRELARHLGFSEQPDPDDVHQVVYYLELDR